MPQWELHPPEINYFELHHSSSFFDLKSFHNCDFRLILRLLWRRRAKKEISTHHLKFTYMQWHTHKRTSSSSLICHRTQCPAVATHGFIWMRVHSEMNRYWWSSLVSYLHLWFSFWAPVLPHPSLHDLILTQDNLLIIIRICWWHQWRGRRTGKICWVSRQSLHGLWHGDQCRVS